MRAQSLGGPYRLGGITETRFFLGHRASRLQAAHEMRDFPRQRLQQSGVGGRRGLRHLARAKLAQPVRCARDRADDAPANDHERNHRNCGYQAEQAHEGAFPKPVALLLDVAGVIKN